MSEEIEFSVKPLFNDDEEKVCICCSKSHIYTYEYTQDVREMIWAFVRKSIRNSDDEYKESSFKITIELLHKETN